MNKRERALLVNEFITVLRTRLVSLNDSSCVLFNSDWWGEKDMDEFLEDFKKRINDASHAKSEGGKDESKI